MVTATLYIEGGGEGKDLRSRFRKGWRAFFGAAGVGSRTKIVRGAGRQQTFKRFVSAVSEPRSGTIPLLLVDSEGAVAAGHSVWQHLLTRDGWRKPKGAGEDHAFLMVQVMETWFLADRAALRRYFGEGFRDKAVRQWPILEDVPKSTVLDALESATKTCRKSYAKGRISFELLGEVDPACVAAACPHAEALLQRLRALAAQA